MLAAFVSPALFWGGTAAVAAPILIHLLARRRFKRLRWAAMEFLIDAERRNRRRMRFEEWILLALRCLAVVLIALIVARPFLRIADAAHAVGGLFAGWTQTAPTERVFILDDSYSMGYRSEKGRSFDRAVEAVRRLIEDARTDTPDDTITIMRMSDPTALVESRGHLADVRTQTLMDRLAALEVSQRSIDLPVVIAQVEEMLQRDSQIVSASVYIVSDFQRGDWAVRSGRAEQTPRGGAANMGDDAADGPDRAGGVLGPLSDWAASDRALRIVLVNVGDPAAANTAIADLQVAADTLVAGDTGTVRTSVGNHTQDTVSSFKLTASIDGADLPERSTGAIAPGEFAVAEFNVPFHRAGPAAIRVSLPDDALPVDNQRFCVVDVSRAIRVLVVNGEPSPDGFDDEALYLAAALRPEGDLFSGHECVVVDELGVEDVNLAGFHTVILANVHRISAPLVESLERFVLRGGGLIVFAGDQVDAESYNASLHRDGRGLLPVKLGDSVQSSDGVHLRVTDPLHPIGRGVTGGTQAGPTATDPLGFGRVPFFGYMRCTVSDDLTEDRGAVEHESVDPAPLGERAGSDGSRGPARVIARFDDAEETPAIIERTFGDGRVTLVATAADREWSQWPYHPTYLPIVTELVRHTARGRAGARDVLVGSPIELPHDPVPFAPNVVVRTPGWPEENETSITAEAAGNGDALVLRWDRTDSAGFYSFILNRRIESSDAVGADMDDAGEQANAGVDPALALSGVRGGGIAMPIGGDQVVRVVAVNVDPHESDLAACDETELRRRAEGVPFTYVRGLDDLVLETSEARMELWRVCLIAAVMVLMTEQFLAWRWGRRR